MKRVVKKVGEQRREQRLLLELLIQELVQLDVSNLRALGELERDTVALYESIRATLSPEDRDAFLRAVLDEVRGLADQKRGELREVVRRYIRSATGGPK